MAIKLQHHWCICDMVGQLTKGLETSPAGDTGRGEEEWGCPLHEGAAQMCGALFRIRACGSGSGRRL